MFGAIAGVVGGKLLKKGVKTVLGGGKTKATQNFKGNGATGSWGMPPGYGGFTPGKDIEIVPDTEYELDMETGEIRPKCKRRRRRRLLTASDKSDIAFLRGTLGGGELGRSAISAVLSRRVS